MVPQAPHTQLFRFCLPDWCKWLNTLGYYFKQPKYDTYEVVTQQVMPNTLSIPKYF